MAAQGQHASAAAVRRYADAWAAAYDSGTAGPARSGGARLALQRARSGALGELPAVSSRPGGGTRGFSSSSAASRRFRVFSDVLKRRAPSMGPNAVQGKAKRIEQELADQAGKNKVWQVDSAPAEPSETVKRLRFVLGNLGYFCTLLGYTMEDMLWLRALMMCSGVLTIGFAALHSPPIWIPIFWCCVFFTINFMYIMRLLADRKEVEFSGLALDAYESAFQAHGFTPRQFQRLMQEGKGAFLEVFEGDALVLQGDPLRKVVFLVSGEADLVIGGRRVAAIKGGNFATSLQCLLEASDAAAAKEVAKRVAERQAEEQDEDDEEDVGHNGAGGGGGAAAAAAAVDLGPNPSEGGAARQAGAGAANPGGSRDGSGAAPARRGKRRLRQEAWMAAAVGDETAGPDQTGTGSGAPGPEGAAPGPDTVDQHLLQPVAASLAAGRRFNRRASRRVLAEENDDWVGGDSAPKPAAAASARGAMDDDLEAGEPEKLGDLLREAGHAFVEAGQAVGVLISEAVKERFQPSDDEDDDEDDDEEDEDDAAASEKHEAGAGAASAGGEGAPGAVAAAPARGPSASAPTLARRGRTASAGQTAEQGGEAGSSADGPASAVPASRGGADGAAGRAASDAAGSAAGGPDKPRKRKARRRRREDVVEDETGGELGQDPEELAATARARQRERRWEQRREDEQQRARKRLMGKRAGSSSQMALFVRETVHDAVEEELEELEEVQGELARRTEAEQRHTKAAAPEPDSQAASGQPEGAAAQAGAKAEGDAGQEAARGTAGPAAAGQGRSPGPTSAGGAGGAQANAAAGAAVAGSDGAVRSRHRRRRRHVEAGAADGEDAEVSFQSATAFVEAAEGRGERTRRKALERRRGAAAGQQRQAAHAAAGPSAGSGAAEEAGAPATPAAAAAPSPPPPAGQGAERPATGASVEGSAGAKPAAPPLPAGAHNRTSAHRATASVLVASPEATVIVWDLDAMRAVIEREKPMRFPAMSMVASEMASRLLLTTRSIERTYQYRKELQRRIHAGSGMLRDADRQALQAWQVANHVTREEHEEALEAVGWTPSDFQAGWSASTAKVAAAKLRQRTGQGVRASMDWFTSRISGIIHQDASSPAANVRLGTPKPENAPPEHRA
ncbi:hypothetical protein FNF29_00833 [Cafeteria roenbergensis]|uniref:POPDC1-3 domain-containing protein n=2 Tax=Cafeteria roenbergensis TaxID=33653 RepID=A0A5A8CU95_CAFRO|nr:hypothetical protein FNF29_00833 [Cafeteria roenbergensis]|eukprot:KAA0156722.1 hypothetical protein FNF29_00833 [Cafeteria roenbergensis]